MGRRLIHIMCIAVVLGLGATAWGQKKASSPTPADGAADVSMPLLKWTPGSTAVFHNVYLGKNAELTEKDLIGSHQFMAFVFLATPLEPGVTYYWRVDEIEIDNVTIHQGDLWSFTMQALTAYKPTPADGDTTVAPTVTLSWWPGQGVAQHHIYFGDNRDAVTSGAASVDKGLQDMKETTFAPGNLQGATAYFWRVDEVIAGGAIRAGAVWSFTTILPIDDFESYTDKEGETIYQTWIDGMTSGLSGSMVGYPNAPFAEQKIIHGGLQSMPLDFNNIAKPYFSETEREFNPPADWTAGGTDSLILYLRGRPIDFEIPCVSAPPVIDGKMDDLWKAATVQPLSSFIQGNPIAGPADFSGQFRTTYDAQNLYVLVDINDSSLRNESTSAYLDDSVEVYFDGDNSKKGAGLTGNNRQFTFGWNATDIQGTNTVTTGIEFAQVNTPTGWRIEIKMPWQSLLSGPAPVYKLIGIDCFYNDDDDGGDTRERQIGWHARLADDWQTPADWGTAKIAPPAGTKTKADTLYVALQDSANHTATVIHPDAKITQVGTWTQWQIPLSSFSGVNLTKVKKVMIGVGDKTDQTAGGLGLLYLDDICLAVPAPAGK